MSGDSAPSLLDLGEPATVTELFARACGSAPEAPALVTRRERLSYRALVDAAEQAASMLRGLGITPGDRIGVCLGNEAEIVVLFLAAMRVGAVWLGINKPLAAPEKAFVLRDAGVRFAFVDRSVIDEFRTLHHELPGLERVVLVDVADPADEWAGLVATAADPLPAAPRRDPFAPALISYTSGTTGHPKGVVHSEHNLVMPGAVLSRGPEFGRGARLGVCLPLTIANMIVMGPLMAAQTHATCVCTDRLSNQALAAWVAREQVESMTLVPTTLFDLVEDPAVDPRDFASLRFVQTGGAPWSPALVDRFAERFGTRPVGTYGLTEAPTNVALEHRDRERVLGASGRPNPHLKVTIVDDDGAALPQGEIGEICLAAATEGPFAGVYRPMLEYLNRPDATRETLRNGTVHTGDRGYLDAHDNLFLVGRGSDLILRGGANVYPAEIELVISDHPAVQGCAVLGVADERLGEVVVAVIEVSAPVTDDALRAHCSEHLARYKVPTRFVRVDVLPRNSMGKVVRQSVRAQVEGA